MNDAKVEQMGINVTIQKLTPCVVLVQYGTSFMSHFSKKLSWFNFPHADMIVLTDDGPSMYPQSPQSSWNSPGLSLNGKVKSCFDFQT